MKKTIKVYYCFFLLLCIAFGLLSRYSVIFPPFLSIHLGDALWASMIYFFARILFSRYSQFNGAILALGFCILIECSQLYQEEWINNIRNTLIGGLILGKGFLWVDLLRYCFGIFFAFLFDFFLLSKK
ncbi:MAG: DUF2809 domain-containing protein [Bacillus sp. (in: firmicutes)]